MNIFNKTFLTITLVFAIPLSIQANWFSNLSDLCFDKNTMAAGAYKVFRFLDLMTIYFPAIIEKTKQQDIAIKKIFAINTIYQAHKSFRQKNQT